MEEKKYNADIYLRLSKDDGDKNESNSIQNQRDLIFEYLKSMPDICVHKIRVDDGFSGVDFNRPAFKEMLKDINAGIVNCVIVKDFSRFGRNYIETGRFIEVIFPQGGIRFIAINDSYDSEKKESAIHDIIVPFKNIINEAMLADISGKIRSAFKVKRKRGDFVGAFATYGYLKDKANHNRLVIDDFAADVVRDIFLWKLNGLSALGIANKLNMNGILSPMEYKRFIGLRFTTSFKLNPSAKWQAATVTRILSNEVYTGVLEQGKRTTPNYKIRKRVNLPKEQWVRVENAHAPIIERPLFDTIQKLLSQDTRARLKNENVLPLSAVIFCADCDSAMFHKTNTKNGKKYGYYVCSNHRANKTMCSTHIISSGACEMAILTALKTYMTAFLSMENINKYADTHVSKQNTVRKLTARLDAKKTEYKQDSGYRLSIYEDYRNSIISLGDYIGFKAEYDKKIQNAESVINALENEITAAKDEAQRHSRINIFNTYLDAENLTRRMVVALVEKVLIYEKGRIEVICQYYDELENFHDLIVDTQRYNAKEVM